MQEDCVDNRYAEPQQKVWVTPESEESLLHLNVFVNNHQVALYILAAVISSPFFGDSSQAPYVRAGTGFHIATASMIILVIVLSLLAILFVIVIFVYVLVFDPNGWYA